MTMAMMAYNGSRSSYGIIRQAMIMMAMMACVARSSASTTVDTTIFTSGFGAYHTYRIPGILQTASPGVWLVFCEGRKLSSADHGWNDIVQRRSTDNGQTWSDITIVHGESNATEKKYVTIGNPAPILDEITGRVWMLFSRNNKAIGAVWSDDTGLSWSGPMDLTASVMAPNNWTTMFTGLSAGMTLTLPPETLPETLPQMSAQARSRLIVCANHDGPPMKDDPNVKLAGRYSSTVFSDDHGETWHGGKSVGPGGSTECNLAAISSKDGNSSASNGGNVFMYTRMWSQPAGKPAYGIAGPSDDGGTTFPKAGFTPMGIDWPQPDCEGTMGVVYTPLGRTPCFVLTAPYGSMRANMTLSYSCGTKPKEWTHDRVLWDGPSAYSSLVPSRDNKTFFVAYERGTHSPYETIHLTQIQVPEWMLK